MQYLKRLQKNIPNVIRLRLIALGIFKFYIKFVNESFCCENIPQSEK